MKKGIILLTGLLVLSCQNYDDQIEDLQSQITKLQITTTSLENILKKKADAEAVIALLNEKYATLLAQVGEAQSNVISHLEGEITRLENQLQSISIPSVDGLVSESDLDALEASLDALSADLEDLSDEVDDLNIQNVVVSAYSPSFASQVENFTQTSTSTLEGIVLDVTTRDIYVYEYGPSSSTVTSTVLSVGRSNVAGISSDTLNDAVVSQTTTEYRYSFHIEDADDIAYEHTITSTTSWTLQN